MTASGVNAEARQTWEVRRMRSSRWTSARFLSATAILYVPPIINAPIELPVPARRQIASLSDSSYESHSLLDRLSRFLIYA